jgi:short-subunit dehydrogenase
MERTVVLITGVTTGMGRAACALLHQKGYTVYGTTRNLKQFNTLNPDPIATRVFQVDITGDASVKKAVSEIISREEKIDVLINNAGYGTAGAAEETSHDAVCRQFDVNFHAMVRMTNAVLPVMRKQHAGLIINISSIVGHMGIPFQSYYCASKYAVEGYSESLRMELKPFGIDVSMVIPGDVASGFTDNRVNTMNKNQASPYAAAMDASLSIVEKGERKGYPPEKVASCIEKIIRKKSPALRYTVGPAEQMLLMRLKKVIPHSLYEKIIMGSLGL